MSAMTLELVRHYHGGHCDLIAQFAAQEVAYPLMQALNATYPGTAFILRPLSMKNDPVHIVVHFGKEKLETVAQFERPYRFVADQMAQRLCNDLGPAFAVQEIRKGGPAVKMMMPGKKPGTWEQVGEKSLIQNEHGIYVPRK